MKKTLRYINYVGNSTIRSFTQVVIRKYFKGEPIEQYQFICVILCNVEFFTAEH